MRFEISNRWTTPENSQIVRITLSWIEEFRSLLAAAK